MTRLGDPERAALQDALRCALHDLANARLAEALAEARLAASHCATVAVETSVEHAKHAESHWQLRAEELAQKVATLTEEVEDRKEDERALASVLQAVRVELGRIVSGGIGGTLPGLVREVERIRGLIPADEEDEPCRAT